MTRQAFKTLHANFAEQDQPSLADLLKVLQEDFERRVITLRLKLVKKRKQDEVNRLVIDRLVQDKVERSMKRNIPRIRFRARTLGFKTPC